MVEKKAYRKQNITGIKYLSIGVTKDSETGKPRSASFYFGAHKSQKEAFVEAVECLQKKVLFSDSTESAMALYRHFVHESLI